MKNLFLISGFNPFNKNEWRIDQYYSKYVSPRKNNWKRKDVQLAIDWYSLNYGNTEYIISAHSDGGTVAYQIAQQDERCIGLHCHAAFFTKEKVERDIPVLITSCKFDVTGMGLVSKLSYFYYKDKFSHIGNMTIPRKQWHGHSYGPSVEYFVDWCKLMFNFEPETSIAYKELNRRMNNS